MANYGIIAPSAYTGTTDSDKYELGNSFIQISGTQVYGLAGDDIINFGQIGRTAVASGSFASGQTPTGLTVTLVASGTNSYATAISGTGLVTVHVAGLITAQMGARSFQSLLAQGGSGNDSIALGNTFTAMSSTSIYGGEGDDLIGSYIAPTGDVFVRNTSTNTFVSGTVANTIFQSFIDGGTGNDTITLDFNAAISTTTGLTVQGGAGNDAVNYINTAGVTNTVQILGGGGSDYLSGEFTAATAFTFAGGGGNDTIYLSAEGTNASAFIAGDAINSRDQYDGSDLITLDLGTYSGINVQGMGGNDTINILGTNGGANSIYGNNGNDVINFSGIISATTVFAGDGADRVYLDEASNSGSLVLGGGGNDEVAYSAMIASSTKFSGGSVYGGLGADRLGSGINVSASSATNLVFGYSAAGDSTLSAFDTIAFGGDTKSATYFVRYDAFDVNAASFSGAHATGTNGTVAFTSTFDNDVTARAQYLSTQLTAGNAVLFVDNHTTKNQYLFIKGSSDNTIVQIGTGSTGVAGVLTINGGKNLTLNLF